MIPLLNEIMGDKSYIIDMHGSNEEGIDVYFEANALY